MDENNDTNEVKEKKKEKKKQTGRGVYIYELDRALLSLGCYDTARSIGPSIACFLVLWKLPTR